MTTSPPCRPARCRRSVLPWLLAAALPLACADDPPPAEAGTRPTGRAAHEPAARPPDVTDDIRDVAAAPPATDDLRNVATAAPVAASSSPPASVAALAADLRLGLPVALQNHIDGLRRVVAEMSSQPSPPALLPRLDALVLRLQELQRRADAGEPLDEIVPADVRTVLQADMADFPKAWLAPDELGRLPGESLPLPDRPRRQ